MVPQVHQALQVHPEPQEIQVKVPLLEQADPQVQLELQDYLAARVHQVLQALQEHPVLQVHQAHQEPQETQVKVLHQVPQVQVDLQVQVV